MGYPLQSDLLRKGFNCTSCSGIEVRFQYYYGQHFEYHFPKRRWGYISTTDDKQLQQKMRLYFRSFDWDDVGPAKNPNDDEDGCVEGIERKCHDFYGVREELERLFTNIPLKVLDLRENKSFFPALDVIVCGSVAKDSPIPSASSTLSSSSSLRDGSLQCLSVVAHDK